MIERLLLAAEDGIVIAQRARDGWEQVGRGLARQRVTSVIAREGVALAGTRHGVFRSDDGGQTCRPASAGISVPCPDHLVERFTQVEDDLLAELSNGELWMAPLASLAWRRLLPQVSDVAAAARLQSSDLAT